MLVCGVHRLVDGYIVIWRQCGDLWTGRVILNGSRVIENRIIGSLGTRFLLFDY